MRRREKSYLDSRTVLSHKQVGINLLQVSLGWKSDSVITASSAEKLCDSLHATVDCTSEKAIIEGNLQQHVYPLTQHYARRRGKLNGCQWKKSFCCPRTKVLGIQNMSSQFK